MMMTMMFQSETLDDNLRPINSSQLTKLARSLRRATAVNETAMSAADLTAVVAVMLRLARIYNVRRNSLRLHLSTMNVSCHSLSLLITVQYRGLLLICFLSNFNVKHV